MNDTAVWCHDGAFGPAINGCRDDFDFTFAFEQYFFSLVPSGLFLLAAPIRIALLRKAPSKVDGSFLRTAKVTTIAMFSCLQLTLLVLWGAQHQYPDGTRQAGLAASALSMAASLTLLPLSYIEHSRSLRPSLLLTAYLAITVLFDIATLRTLWAMSAFDSLITLRPVFTTSFALKVTLLILEAAQKREFFLEQYQNTSPEESSGLLGQGLMLWLNKLIFFGARHLLTPRNIYPVTADMRSEKLGGDFWGIWEKTEEKSQSLKKSLFRLLWWPILIPILPRLALLAFTMCQPLMLQRLLNYLSDPAQLENRNIGYGLVGAAVIIYIGMAVSAAIYWHRQYRFMAMIRGSLTTAVFKKTLQLNTSAANDAKTVTLMSADCERIVRGLMDLHELWANVSQVALATYLIQTQLGVACVAPVAVTLLTTGLTVVVANFTPRFQIRWIEKLESRIAVTSSVLDAMKAIKITNLTQKVSKVLSAARENELAAASSFRIVSVITATIGYVPQLVSPVVTFAVFIAVAKGNNTSLDATRVFTSLSLLLLVADPLFNLFGGLVDFMTALACLKRVQDFLTTAPRADKRVIIEAGKSLSTEPTDKSACIVVKDCTFGWGEDKSEVVTGFNLTVNSGEIVTIVGPVACGKSTVIKGLLGSTPVFEGSVTLAYPEISFCDQSPWIMNGTVRSNIIYASEFDSDLYNAVINACDLETDFGSLSKGDMTIVGSKGFALSAGQRQRVALARAVYSRNKIAILDDVFSQLDINTQNNIAQRLLGSDGLFRRWGTPVVMTASSSRLLSYADKIISLSQDGKVIQQGSFDDLKNVPGYIQDVVQPESGHANDSSETSGSVEENSGSTNSPVPKIMDVVEDVEAEDAKPPATDLSVYKYYLSRINWKNTAIFLVFQICLAVSSAFGYIWIKWWTDESSEFPNARTSYYIGIYAALQGAALAASALVTWWSLNVLAVVTGLQLHADLSKTVMSSTMKLFSSTDSGNILNRFTQDLQLADVQLPLAVQVVVTNLLIGICQAGLIASASGWIALSYPFLLAVFYLIPKYYVKTARQMRSLDLEEKAPLYTHFLETLSGLTTIRAFSTSHFSIKHHFSLVDRSQKPFYLMYVIQKWLGLVLDLAIAGLAALVVGLAVGPLRTTISPGFTGVSLTQIVSFTGYLKMLVLFWAQMQMAMEAVRRVRDFGRDTEVEDDGGDEVDEDWPERGEVVIKGLGAKYWNEDAEPVLQDINLEIKPGEKVCICGRTGSGKSSLVLTLLRLLDPTEGTIEIDGIDINSVSRHTVRSRVAGVAEEPFFLPDTVRDNMDPYGQETDDRIIQTLVDVGLWTGVFDKEDGRGLDATLDKEQLSHGQRQLFNIARAMLRGSRLLVLDEVTSSLDAQAEKLIYRLFETRLKHCTVIAVIHKVEFAHGFDMIVTMEKGRIVDVVNGGE
ncbi:ABC transporter [Podospora fimiseda]|uniref:ABC transporter n=1 Tax=Podospora fimiseda TaxID=252190 RepID=A0AAN6YP23_9PEZI|nr:ABC transporter [Podospora fimiseda]